jgi:Ca2+-binding RTX toxin-like protein
MAGFKAGNGSGNKTQGKGALGGTVNDDHILGTKGVNTMDGDAGNDVIVGYAGADLLEGGDGADNLTGGTDNDVLVGGIWTDSTETGSLGAVDAGEVADDADADTYVAASSAAGNGTDTIYGYGAEDVIDLSAALQGTFNNILSAQLDTTDTAAAWATLMEAGYVALEGGVVSLDADGSESEVEASAAWFNVNVIGSEGWASAEQVTVLIGVNSFTLAEIAI